MISVEETKIAKLEAEVAALELERDHLVMAIAREGLKVGSHGSGLCITEESLARLKARWKAEVLEGLANIWETDHVYEGDGDGASAMIHTGWLRERAYIYRCIADNEVSDAHPAD